MQRQTESSVCLLVRRTQRISLKRIKKNSLRLQLETFLIMTVKKTWGWAKAISSDHHHTFLGFCLCNSYLSVLVQPLYINLCRKYALHPLQQLQVSLQLARDSCRICFGTIVKTGLKKYVMRVWWKPLLRFSRMIIFRKNTALTDFKLGVFTLSVCHNWKPWPKFIHFKYNPFFTLNILKN